MINQTYIKKDRSITDNMLKVIIDTAITGLKQCYKNPSSLPYAMIDKKQTGDFYPDGQSIRYAAISQIGIEKWKMYHPDNTENLPDLKNTLMASLSTITDIGDIALILWALAQGQENDCAPAADALIKAWPAGSQKCNAVELAWVVKAATKAICHWHTNRLCLDGILKEAHTRLVNLFNPHADLFKRHDRKAISERISSRIACFADQVYPILAFASFGQSFDHDKSLQIAARTCDSICDLQGQKGQWHWHYDSATGQVCEEYPVFSVHQDAMAPMAINAIDNAMNTDHSAFIKRGMKWLFGINELNAEMILQTDGIILRDIERKEPGKFSRKARSLACLANLKTVHKNLSRTFNHYKINRQCRPYHLGWILYAWADHNAEK